MNSFSMNQTEWKRCTKGEQDQQRKGKGVRGWEAAQDRGVWVVRAQLGIDHHRTAPRPHKKTPTQAHTTQIDTNVDYNFSVRYPATPNFVHSIKGRRHGPGWRG
jgi:hypothetical protein